MFRNYFFMTLILFSHCLHAIKPDYGQIIDTFVGFEDFMDHVRLIKISDDGLAPYYFFGIHEKNLLKIDYSKLKEKITSLMGISKNNAIQIIGDSGKFSEEGTCKARKFLRVAIDKANLVEYGFTGYKSADGKTLDINSFVNEYIDEKPSISKKVLANIVGHTPVAMNKWGTYGSPNVHYYVAVFNDYDMSKEPVYEKGKKVGGFTTFGNDIIASDYLLQEKDGDKFLCLEGGVQSFLQVINALKLKIPVTLVYNLRTTEREKFFSATRYLKQIAEAYSKNSKLTQKEVQSIFDEYEKQLENIWDPNKADYKTKKELFDTAMDRFIKGNLYKQVLNLCTFIDAKNLPS